MDLPTSFRKYRSQKKNIEYFMAYEAQIIGPVRTKRERLLKEAEHIANLRSEKQRESQIRLFTKKVHSFVNSNHSDVTSFVSQLNQFNSVLQAHGSRAANSFAPLIHQIEDRNSSKTVEPISHTSYEPQSQYTATNNPHIQPQRTYGVEPKYLHPRRTFPTKHLSRRNYFNTLEYKIDSVLSDLLDDVEMNRKPRRVAKFRHHSRYLIPIAACAVAMIGSVAAIKYFRDRAPSYDNSHSIEQRDESEPLSSLEAKTLYTADEQYVYNTKE